MPFFEWNAWIKDQLELSLTQYKEKKASRLQAMARLGSKVFRKADKVDKKGVKK